MKAIVYWIEGPWRGRLAILQCPRGGEWLEDEIRSWRSAGVDLVVSTLQSDEVDALDLAEEPEWCKRSDIEFVAFPVSDRGVPASFQAAADLLQRLVGLLAAGKTVAIHCRHGVGRSTMLSASLLARAGVPCEAAFDRVRAARGCPVPDTAEQGEWVAMFARDHLAALAGD
jgi:protein-tyrosine phosphatase